MQDWMVEVTFNANDFANKVLDGVVNVQVDNCIDAGTACAIAGSNVRRYFQDIKVGIIKAVAKETEKKEEKEK